jgi:type II secretory pathway component PulK
MKIDYGLAHRAGSSRQGFAVLIVLVLLAFMVVLTAANTATVNRLRDRVRIVDQRQTHRLAVCSTNALRAFAPPAQQP